MNRRRTVLVLAAIIGFVTAVRSVHACPEPIDVYIDDWYRYAGVGESISFSADVNHQPNGWYWSWSSGISGSYSDSSASVYASSPGYYYIWADAWDDYSEDSDYGVIIAFSVSVSPLSAYVAAGNSVQFTASSQVSGGSFSWSGWGTGSGTLSPTTGSTTTFSAGQPGYYFAVAQYAVGGGTATQSATIWIFDVSLNTLSGTVPFGSSLQLGATPQGVTTGTYSWTKVSGSGNVTFSPSNSSSPMFSADQPGNYVVQVAYTVNGSTATRTSGTFVVTSPTVAITTPSSFPVYVAKSSSIQLDCTPSITGGTYTWSQTGGTGTGTFSDTHAKNPTFTGTGSGPCTITVQYTVGGVTVSDTKDPINVVAVGISTPSSFPAYVGKNASIQLDCTPSITGGTYTWSQTGGTGTGTFSDTHAKNPTFTGTAGGTCTIKVEYTVGGVTVSDTKDPINVVSVGISTPPSFPAYVGKNASIQLDCTPSITGGTYTWSQTGGTGTGTFSDTHAKNPTFTGTGGGPCTITVQYTLSGVTVSDTKNPINVVSVGISTPSSFPAYVGKNSSIQVDCTPSITGGTYTWSQTGGTGSGTFSDTHAKNPTFTGTGGGPCTITVQYTVSGVTVSDTKNPINVVSVGISTPSSFPAYVGKNSSIQLDCTPSITGGTYTWSQTGGTGTGTFSDTHAKNPTFTGTGGGPCTITVQYTVSGVTVSDTKNPINVVSVGISSPSSFPAYVGKNASIQLDCTPSITGGTYTWSQTGGTGTGTFSDTHAKNPTLTGTAGGTCTIKVEYTVGGVTVSDTKDPINVVAVGISTPSSFPAHVGVNSSIQLDCTPSITGGTYTWSQTGGTGTGTFSDTHAKNPTFTGTGSGPCTITVQYTVGGVTVSDTKDPINVVAVGISTPSSFPAFVGMSSSIQLDCTPSITGGTYTWSQTGGTGTGTFSDTHAKNPTFTGTGGGPCTITVQYTVGGVTVSDTKDPINVVAVGISTPSSFPAFVGMSSSIQLDCTPSITGGTYTWSQTGGTGTGTFSDTHAKNPTFTGTGTGPCMIKVEYTVGGVTSSDTKDAINVVAVGISTPSSFPAFVGVNSSIQLDCTPSIIRGTYTWSQTGGTGTGTFSDPHAKNPTFTGTGVGTCTIKVEYTVGGVTVSDTKDPINVVAVGISTPSSFPAYVGVSSSIQLDCTPSITGGTYTWSQTGGTGTGTFSDTHAKNPTFTGTGGGSCAIKVEYTVGGVTVSDTKDPINVVSVGISTPSAFPAYVGKNAAIQLDCAPSITGGTYTWSQTGGTGTGTFSDSHAKNPTFTGSTGGTCTIKVEYTVGGVTVSDTKDPINVVAVGISAPSSFPAYVGVSSSIQLDCTPSITGGTYTWSQTGGTGTGTFSDTHAKNPTFTGTGGGSCAIKVEYTVGGVTVSDTKDPINVVSVGISTPSSFPAYVGKNASIQLDCTPSITGGTYTWSQTGGTGTGTFSDTHAKNPTFTGTGSGPCTITVQYTVGGVTVSDTKDPINVVAVGISTPSSFPAYVGMNSSIQLDCTPSITGGTYTWSQTGGTGTGTFSDSHAKNPTFTGSTGGTCTIKVEYTVGGVTVSDTKDPINVVSTSIGGSFPIYVGLGSSLRMGCVCSVAGGTYTWSVTDGPGAGTFNGANDPGPSFTGTTGGPCTIKVEYTIGGVTVSDTKGPVNVVAVGIIAPSSFPAYVGVNSSIQLDCTPSITGGTYMWSQTGGTGTGAFSDTHAKNPTFTGTTAGPCTIKAEYTVGGVTVSDTKDPITVIDLTVNTASPIYVAVNTDLQLSTTPQGATGGSFTWTKSDGPGNVTFTDSGTATPQFNADQYGDYTVQVTWTMGSATIAKTIGPITVIDASVSMGAHPSYIGYGTSGADFSFTTTPDSLPVSSYTCLAIRDGQTPIRTVNLGQLLGSGTAHWDGKLADGQTWAPAGVYTATIELHADDCGLATASTPCSITTVRATIDSTEPFYYRGTTPAHFTCTITPTGASIQAVSKLLIKSGSTVIREMDIGNEMGTHVVPWNGLTNDQIPALPDSYTAEISTTVDETVTVPSPSADAPVYGVALVPADPTFNGFVQVNDNDDNENGFEDWCDPGNTFTPYIPYADPNLIPFTLIANMPPLPPDEDGGVDAAAVWWDANGEQLLRFWSDADRTERTAWPTNLSWPWQAWPASGPFKKLLWLEANSFSSGTSNMDPYIGADYGYAYLNEQGDVIDFKTCLEELFPSSLSMRVTLVKPNMTLAGVADDDNSHGTEETDPGAMLQLDETRTLTLCEVLPQECDIADETWGLMKLEVIYSGAGRIEVFDAANNDMGGGGSGDVGLTIDNLTIDESADWSITATQLSSDYRDITLRWTHKYTGFVDEIQCTVINAIQIANVIMPNDFIATPDVLNETRFKTNTTSPSPQTAKTDVRVWYYINENFTFDRAYLDFKYDGRLCMWPYYISAEPGLHYVDVSLELKSPQPPGENQYDWAVPDNILIQVVLTAEQGDPGDPDLKCESTRLVPGRHLLKNIEFSPKAYQPNGGTGVNPSDPVCPYTHGHDPIALGDGDNAHKWWGLLTTYSLPSGVVLDTLEPLLWSGTLSTKELTPPAGALDGTNCKIKWEGYDDKISEPAELPYCVFPLAIGGQQPAPIHVVAEGRYWYQITATDSRTIPDRTLPLQQSCQIVTIPIHVRYNMTDP